jgi:hypothetical protein
MTHFYRSTELPLTKLESKKLACVLVSALLFLSALVIPASASQRMVLAEGFTNYT